MCPTQVERISPLFLDHWRRHGVPGPEQLEDIRPADHFKESIAPVFARSKRDDVAQIAIACGPGVSFEFLNDASIAMRVRRENPTVRPCFRVLLARIALMGEYHRGPEQRRAIIGVLKRVLLPPEPAAAAEPASLPPKGPVPYSPEGHFELGQTLIHKKFGDVTVTSVGETWIEVQIPADGSKKRLAHKP